MTQDFAKKKRAPDEPATGTPKWTWFLGGFLSGAFLAFLLTITLLIPSSTQPVTNTDQPTAEPTAKADEMQWDFYEIFPRSVVPLVEEYTTNGEKVVVDNVQWVLQAGSFKDPADADARRAELLLLGLNATTTSVDMAGIIWHRVIVGPFDTPLARNRAQDKLAQAQIQSMAMSIPKT